MPTLPPYAMGCANGFSSVWRANATRASRGRGLTTRACAGRAPGCRSGNDGVHGGVVTAVGILVCRIPASYLLSTLSFSLSRSWEYPRNCVAFERLSTVLYVHFIRLCHHLYNLPLSRPCALATHPIYLSISPLHYKRPGPKRCSHPSRQP